MNGLAIWRGDEYTLNFFLPQGKLPQADGVNLKSNRYNAWIILTIV
jgi:hypothetical protein